MQAGVLFRGAPVASVQGVSATQAERTGDRRAAAFGQHDDQLAVHRSREMAQEFQR